MTVPGLYSVFWSLSGYAMGLAGACIALRVHGGLDCSGLGAKIARLVAAAAVLTVAILLVFRAALTATFPRLELAPSWSDMAEAVSLAFIGAGGSLAITGLVRRSVRNVILAGSALSCLTSCMVFTCMSGFAAPAVLAYDLSTVLAAMVASSTLCAAGFWLFRAPRRTVAVVAAPALLSLGLIVLSIVSLAAILPFSDWTVASTMPNSIAFRPVTVVFVSELGVTLALGMLGAGVDHQAAGMVQRENARLRQLTESTFEALLIHRDGVILDANARFCELIELPPSMIRGRPVAAFVPNLQEAPAMVDAAGTPPIREAEITTQTGERLPVEILSREIGFLGGNARVTALRDIRERRAAEARILYLAQHDSLTGLLNRAQFRDVISRQLALMRRNEDPIAVFCVDLDRFKSVNDTVGHQAGDVLLKQVAERLVQSVRETDTVARVGGDEFVLLQTGVGQPDGAGTLAARIIEALTLPFDLGGHQACIGASVGIALGPQDGSEADELIRKADTALYRAKSNGRGTFCFFEREMDALLQQRREMEQNIARAVGANEFRLAFQPLFEADVASRIVGFEALIRWPTAKGPVPPDQFIPLAEETGLIVPLGAWVLETACREAVSWPEPYRVAVNVSPRQLAREDFVEVVAGVLQRTGLEPRRLEIEITETVLIKDAEAAMQVLQRLKAMGVRIILDDFGTGYSSLSYLQRFPFDKVKIDKSFVRSLGEDDNARAIVGAILAMCHQLHLEVTAEGVETPDQLDELRARHCDQIQGFLLSRPLPAEEVRSFLLRRGEAPRCLT